MKEPPHTTFEKVAWDPPVTMTLVPRKVSPSKLTDEPSSMLKRVSSQACVRLPLDRDGLGTEQTNTLVPVVVTAHPHGAAVLNVVQGRAQREGPRLVVATHIGKREALNRVDLPASGVDAVAADLHRRRVHGRVVVVAVPVVIRPAWNVAIACLAGPPRLDVNTAKVPLVTNLGASAGVAVPIDVRPHLFAPVEAECAWIDDAARAWHPSQGHQSEQCSVLACGMIRLHNFFPRVQPTSASQR